MMEERTISHPCLITNESWPPGAIACTRILVKGKDVAKGEEVDRLERMWIAPNLFDSVVLNPDIRLRPVRLDWLASYDARRWTLVPKPSVLNEIISNLILLKSSRSNAAWDTSYTYSFISLALQDHPIVRLETYRRFVVPTPYDAPYLEFPELVCGSHQYVVIYKALRQYNQRLGDLPSHSIEIYSKLFLINALWNDLSSFPRVSSLPEPTANGRKRLRISEAEGVAGPSGRTSQTQTNSGQLTIGHDTFILLDVVCKLGVTLRAVRVRVSSLAEHTGRSGNGWAIHHGLELTPPLASEGLRKTCSDSGEGHRDVVEVRHMGSVLSQHEGVTGWWLRRLGRSPDPALYQIHTSLRQPAPSHRRAISAKNLGASSPFCTIGPSGHEDGLSRRSSTSVAWVLPGKRGCAYELQSGSRLPGSYEVRKTMEIVYCPTVLMILFDERGKGVTSDQCTKAPAR
ncbi:hypothetical protein BV25DRAFT_1900382 [Artomyces pyxidatus]|uniref:Uncharacterized protein n=1 Tax=Artomyces pyxidatus TaxID=48021 RepID=A0ACB8SZ42_9AGAM|nr:hypothetical protein BV25DRAFT_1900382 [Artomyces pyxidatus]